MNLILGVGHGCSTEQEIPVQARHASFTRFLGSLPLALEPTTGEVHLRHHISPSGHYRGKKVVKGSASDSLGWAGSSPMVNCLPFLLSASG
jgi:ribosomal protein L32